jgi:hypothetical protein
VAGSLLRLHHLLLLGMARPLVAASVRAPLRLLQLQQGVLQLQQLLLGWATFMKPVPCESSVSGCCKPSAPSPPNSKASSSSAMPLSAMIRRQLQPELAVTIRRCFKLYSGCPTGTTCSVPQPPAIRVV